MEPEVEIKYEDSMVDVSYMDDMRLILWSKDETRMYYFDLPDVFDGEVRIEGEDRTQYPFTPVFVVLTDDQYNEVVNLYKENTEGLGLDEE